MSPTTVLNSLIISILLPIVSLVMILTLVNSRENRRFLRLLAEKKVGISIVLFVCILIIPIALSLLIDRSFISRKVLTAFMFQLTLSVIMVLLIILQFRETKDSKLDNQQSRLATKRIDRILTSSAASKINITVRNDDLSRIARLFSEGDYHETLDEKSFTDICEVFLLAQNDEQISVEKIFLAIDVLINYPKATPELLAEVLIFLHKYYSIISPQYLLHIDKKVLPTIISNLNNMDLASRKSIMAHLEHNGIAERITEITPVGRVGQIRSLEDYERSKQLPQFIYFPSIQEKIQLTLLEFYADGSVIYTSGNKIARNSNELKRLLVKEK